MIARLATFSIVAVAMCVPSAPLRAQASDSTASALVAQWRLRPGTVTRVAAAGVGRVQGRFAAIQEGDILLGGPSKIRVAARAIDSLWVRDVGWKRGARTGAWVGGSAAIAFELLGDLAMGAPLEVTDYLATGAIGATVGALVGVSFRVLFFSRWQMRHPAR